MSLSHATKKPCWALLAALMAVSTLTGCQTDIGGQTLPSAWYLRDDVQYFPAGPEFLLPNQVRAIDEYRAEQDDLAADLEAVLP